LGLDVYTVSNFILSAALIAPANVSVAPGTIAGKDTLTDPSNATGADDTVPLAVVAVVPVNDKYTGLESLLVVAELPVVS
jgi:hypothetical protein